MKPLHLAICVLLLAPAAPRLSAQETADDIAPADARQDDATDDPSNQAQSEEQRATAAGAEKCLGDDCPKTINERLFYTYGTLCSGINWRFLKAIAQAESGLNTSDATGQCQGLFQLNTEACNDNIKDFKKSLNCGNLYDPEPNTAAAAYRFDRIFTGKNGFPSLLKTCPDNSVKEDIALVYIGHNNGPGVLKYVLQRKACKDKDIRKAIVAFYQNNKFSRDDGKYYKKDGSLADCPQKYEVKGVRSLHCVSAEYGIKKYEFGKKKVADKAGDVDKIYSATPERTNKCPSVTSKRLIEPVELKKLLASPGKLNEETVGPKLSESLQTNTQRADQSNQKASHQAKKIAENLPAPLPVDGGGGMTAGGGSQRQARPARTVEQAIHDANAMPANQLPSTFQRTITTTPPDPIRPHLPAPTPVDPNKATAACDTWAQRGCTIGSLDLDCVHLNDECRGGRF